ncbi:MAG TPA: nucleotidyltransferase family protein [Blastocatellia bacterium]|nr:nucleotidyltransferase family protein [Blastocatellia bacterium]
MKPSSRAVSGMISEHELLVCCARTYLDSKSAARVAALVQQRIDWDYLVRAATHHSLLPLLHSHLSAICPDDIPGAASNRLKEHSQNNSRNSLLLTGELIKLQRLFQSQDIPMVPFKGPILAACFYGDVGLRQFSDLDLLVRKQDVFKARDILISAQYLPRYRLGATQRAAMVEQKCEEPFDRDDNAATVDLHWAVIPTRFSFAPDIASIWQGLERVSLSGCEFLTVAPEDLIMLICIHGAKHAWERLGWICDLAELIRARRSLDWNSVIETGRRSGGQRILSLGLFLASDLLDAPLPPGVFESVQSDRQVRSLAAKVYSNLSRRIDRQISVFERDLFYLQSMNRVKDRAHLLSDHIKPTPLEWQMVPLPPYLSFFYYPLRPIRIIEKHWQSLTKRMLSK